MSSRVKDKPLLVQRWKVVSDPESVLVRSNMLVPEQGSVGRHSRLDLELDSISEWVSWVVEWSSVNEEGLVCVVVANSESHVSRVPSCVHGIKAVSSWRSDVSNLSWVVGHLLVVLISPWSDTGVVVNLELLVVLVGDGIVLLEVGSDRSGSSVEGEPLSLISWKGRSLSEVVSTVS